MLTLGVIDRVSVVVFLTARSNKARKVKTVLEASMDAGRILPTSLMTPVEERFLWLLNHPAAGISRSIKHRLRSVRKKR